MPRKTRDKNRKKNMTKITVKSLTQSEPKGKNRSQMKLNLNIRITV